MRNTILFAALLPLIAHAQITFERTYGGAGTDMGFSVKQTSDGGYILAGGTWSFGAGSADMYLVKVDAIGNEEWSKTFGSALFEYAYSVQQTADGGYVLCGGWSGLGTDTLTLVRTNASGDPQWIHHYPISVPRSLGLSVLETSDGGFVACGFTGFQSDEDMVVLKTDAQGLVQWTRTLDLGRSEAGYSVRQTADNGFVVLGLSFITYGVDGDLLLVRMDQTGDTLWTNRYQTAENEEGHGLSANSDGGFTITARKGAVPSDLFLMRTTSSGDTLWTRKFGTPLGNDEGLDVAQTQDGDFVVTGSYQATTSAPTGMYLLRTDGTGALLWERHVFRNLTAISQSLDLTSDGGCVMLGYTGDTLGGNLNIDMFLVKTDGAGYSAIPEVTRSSDRIDLFPNPANDATHIEIRTSETGPLLIIVTDASGRVVVQEQVAKDTVRTIDCFGLDNGVYSVSLQNDQAVIAARLLVVSH